MDAPPDASLSCDVLVIGAGPAGSAAALQLARRGVDVVLADRLPFPREKVCGDALIPDALAALDRLGLRERVLARARRLSLARVHSPNGSSMTLDAESACVPRVILDDILRTAAVDAGARFIAPCRAVGPLLDRDAVCGAVLRETSTGRTLHVRARGTVLATGAAADALRTFGVARRVEASADAARLYFHLPAGATEPVDSLVFSFDRQSMPGYGWVFAGPGSLVNVGVALFHDRARTNAERNLRTMLDRFLTSFEPARRVAEAASTKTRLLGAPLRTALSGAAFSRPGLLVVGEAAGTTYSLTGEGIGKALETGMLGARVLVDALDRSEEPDRTADRYARELESTYRARFRAYETAQRYLRFPRLADLLVARAREGSRLRRQFEAMFRETAAPTDVFSPAGLVRTLLG